MTRDEILNIPAGRDLDVLVAERVMGFVWQECRCLCGHEMKTLARHKIKSPTIWHNGFDMIGVKHPRDLWGVPFYSTNISAAWEVAQVIGSFFIDNTAPSLGIDVEFFRAGHKTIYKATADTAPLAICRAALLAVMGDES